MTKVSSFLYFLAAVVMLTGLLYIGGYIGNQSATTHYSVGSNMAKLVGDPSHSDDNGSAGGCASCKWY